MKLTDFNNACLVIETYGYNILVEHDKDPQAFREVRKALIDLQRNFDIRRKRIKEE